MMGTFMLTNLTCLLFSASLQNGIAPKYIALFGQKVKFLEKLVWIRGAYQYAKALVVKVQDKTNFWRAAGVIYQRGLSRSLSAERAAEFAY